MEPGTVLAPATRFPSKASRCLRISRIARLTTSPHASSRKTQKAPFAPPNYSQGTTQLRLLLAENPISRYPPNFTKPPNLGPMRASHTTELHDAKRLGGDAIQPIRKYYDTIALLNRDGHDKVYQRRKEKQRGCRVLAPKFAKLTRQALSQPSAQRDRTRIGPANASTAVEGSTTKAPGLANAQSKNKTVARLYLLSLNF